MGSKQERMQEKLIFALASHCASLQLGCGVWDADETTCREDDAEHRAQPRLSAHSEYEDVAMEDDVDEIPDGMVGDLHADHGWTASTQKGSLYHKRNFGWRKSTDSATAEIFWSLLRRFIEESEDCNSAGFHLRLIAVDAILQVHDNIQPPMWLLVPFAPETIEIFPSPEPETEENKDSNADLAGLMRVYMRHGRDAAAAAVAVDYLSRIANSIPSIALPRPATICLPHALLQQLQRRLSDESPLAKELNDCLKAVEHILERQTVTLEEIYKT